MKNIGLVQLKMIEEDMGGHKDGFLTSDINVLLLTCLLCDFFFCNEAEFFVCFLGFLLLLLLLLLFLTMGKWQEVGTGEGGDTQYLNPGKQPRTAKCHLQLIQLANTHTLTHINYSYQETMQGKRAYSFLLAVLVGMNATQYNTGEGVFWRQTGKVFKLSICGSYKSAVSMTVWYASKDLA